MTDSGDMATESGRKHNGTPVADLSSEKNIAAITVRDGFAVEVQNADELMCFCRAR